MKITPEMEEAAKRADWDSAQSRLFPTPTDLRQRRAIIAAVAPLI